jgi:hypothetical protein
VVALMTPEEHRREAEVCRTLGLHELADHYELAAIKIEREVDSAEHDKRSQPSWKWDLYAAFGACLLLPGSCSVYFAIDALKPKGWLRGDPVSQALCVIGLIIGAIGAVLITKAVRHGRRC